MAQIITDVPSQKYHADTTTISKHGLDKIAQAPAVYLWSLQNQKTEKSAALRWGTLVHLAVLEPKKLSDETIVLDVDRRTKEGKAAYAEACESGKEIISSDEFSQLTEIRNSIYRNRACAELLTGELGIEHSVYWKDSETGVSCRARPDAIRTDGIVFDIKTTSGKATVEGFQKDCVSYRYAVQAAFYLDGLRAAGAYVNSFVFVVVEKEAPYLSAAFVADDEFIDIGRQIYRKDLKTFAECLDTGVWPAYSHELQPLSLPNWFAKNHR